MKRNGLQIGVVCVAVFGCCWASASAQVVRIAPIVTSTPTPDTNAIFLGLDPPPSAGLIDGASTFYVEVWATNVGVPFNGLACVHVDLLFDRTDLMDAVSPTQSSPLFPVNAVPPIFDDPAGSVGDIGGCQTIPPTDGLGVGEWALVERVQFDAVGTGGPITVSVVDAGNIFAGTSLIGELNNVDPADIDFQIRVFHVGECILDGVCDDADACTADTCASGVCVNTDTTPAGQCCDPLAGGLTPIDDTDACTADVCNADGTVTHTDTTPPGQCCNPITGALTPIDDNNACTIDVCNADGSVTNADVTPPGECCNPLNGGLTPIDDGNVCTIDTCNPDGSVTHADTTPAGQCCNPLTGVLTPIDDSDECTADSCNADGTVTNTDTTPAGQCCDPLTGVLTPIDDGDACTADVCNANGSVSHTDTTPAGQCCAPSTGVLTPIDDSNVCTVDTCNADGSVTHADTTPPGQCCDPITGGLTPISDGDACTIDVCNADGTVTHTDATELGQCCDPLTGGLTPIDDANACTTDVCNADGTVTHTDTTPVGQCCAPADGALILIDDGDACTADVCNADGTVTHTDTTPAGQCCDPLTGLLTAIDDGTACTTDTCNPDGTVTHTDTTPPGQCCDPITGALTVIDDSNLCTDDVCNPDGSVTHTDNAAPCNDGDICTVGDVCSLGVCGGSAVDCSGLDDACNVGVCNPVSGVCEATATNDGLACDDGDACTTGDVCSVGNCGGFAVNCSSFDDACNAGVCNAISGLCEALPINEGLSCDDGQLCTSSDVCVSGVCTGTPIPDCVKCTLDTECNDANPCTDDSCHPSGFCINTNNTNPCTDGDLCTVSDVCSGGVCAGAPTDCTGLDDDCNVGVCNAATGACEASPVNEGLACDDGDLCTVNTFCDVGSCSGFPVNCTGLDDDCNIGTCNAATGLCEAAPTNEGGSCEDGDVCTTGDRCSAGVCSGGSIPGCINCTIDTDCDDGNPCTDGTCFPTGVCIFDDNTNKCDDGDACTASDVCGGGGCAGTPIPDCTSCIDPGDCDDANACTADTCIAGVCDNVDVTLPGECCNPVNGANTLIDDGNDCTTDTCNPDGTVTHTDTTPPGECCDPLTGLTLPIDDANVCTIDVCNADGTVTHIDTTPLGMCCDPITGGLTAIDDGNVCTDDACNPDGTISHTDNTAPCDDGDACTSGDVCGGGACGGAAIDCSGFDDFCVIGSCNPITGICEGLPANEGLACDDGDACTTGDVCTAGVCGGSESADPLCRPVLDLVPSPCDTCGGSGPTCFGLGEFITISIEMGASTPSIIGGQFFLEYDPNTLLLFAVDPGDAPFIVEIFESVDQVAGTIDYAVGSPPLDPGTTLPTTMAVMTFQVIGECESFVRFRPHDPPTQLVDTEFVARDPTFGSIPTLLMNLTPPVMTCPPDITLNAAAGTFGAVATWAPVTSEDSCDGAVTVTCDAQSGSTFSVGTTTVTCQSTNTCSAGAMCLFDVTVNPVSELNVFVQISPTMVPGPLTRCITFDLWQCGFVQATVKQEITFINGVALDQTILVPAGFYQCVTSRDELHTLRSTSPDFSIDGTKFFATFVGDPNVGGHWLTAGNLDDSAFIDIVDFGIWQSSVGVIAPNTDCSVGFHHADINGDGLIDSADFTFIQAHFFAAADPTCCDDPDPIIDPTRERGPIRSISVRELTQRGLGGLRVADLNNDGRLDETDMKIAEKRLVDNMLVPVRGRRIEFSDPQ